VKSFELSGCADTQGIKLKKFFLTSEMKMPPQINKNIKKLPPLERNSISGIKLLTKRVKAFYDVSFW
jgi:hypothetical protein